VADCNLTKAIVVRALELPVKTEMSDPSSNNVIAFGGSSFNMTSSLSVLREAGLGFNRFVASVVVKKCNRCTSTSANVGKLKVKLDGRPALESTV
jgi:hypothetical protein